MTETMDGRRSAADPAGRSFQTAQLARSFRRGPSSPPTLPALRTLALLAMVGACGPSALAATPPDLGPNVVVFDPSMPLATIQAKVDAIAQQQVANEFGPERYAVLFEPGHYGSAALPLNFEVGYYTSVAGLGASPGDVVVNGSINVYNQCKDGNCIALNNFWRSLSNLKIQVNNGSFGCHAGEFWAVSQAAPMRRVDVEGQFTLMDYCSGPSYASGGFIADSRFDGTVISGSQQQWLVRNSQVGGWSNGVWNQVFSGVVGAPAPCFPAAADCGGPYTTLPTSPVVREAPYLYVDAKGDYRVFVPALQRDTKGVTWAAGPTPGTSIGIDDFYIAKPGDRVSRINAALARGQHLLLTPGIYALDAPIVVRRDDTVVLGLGLATLVPTKGDAALRIEADGAKVAAIAIDAGPRESPVLLQVAGHPGRGHAYGRGRGAEPTSLHDVFFRIGGMAAGRAKTSLLIEADGTLLDNLWAWRADHGNGVGWTINTADHGVIVEADDVTAYGLFVEHYQKEEVIWKGERGRVVFFQNEMPYDPPSQSAWMARPGVLGYPALVIDPRVRSFRGWGMGSYSFFNQRAGIFASTAFDVPTTLPKGSLQNLLTIFLDPVNGDGGILNVVNNVGGSSTIANPATPVTVQSYP